MLLLLGSVLYCGKFSDGRNDFKSEASFPVMRSAAAADVCKFGLILCRYSFFFFQFLSEPTDDVGLRSVDNTAGVWFLDETYPNGQ